MSRSSWDESLVLKVIFWLSLKNVLFRKPLWRLGDPEGEGDGAWTTEGTAGMAKGGLIKNTFREQSKWGLLVG